MYRKFIVNLISVLCFPVDTEFFKGVKYLSFFRNVNYIHHIVQWAKGVALIYNMLDQFLFIIRVTVIIVVLTEPYPERSVSLANIFHMACGTREFVHSVHIIFFLFMGFVYV